MKKYERQTLIAVLTISVILISAGVWSYIGAMKNSGRIISSAGLVVALAGLIQLEVSGFFSEFLNKFDNEEKYPYGPPSYITREIIDNPDRPIRTKMRNLAFFDVRTGFWLIVASILLQLVGTWL